MTHPTPVPFVCTDERPARMAPVEVYRIYVAMKLHFQKDSYDFFKNGGRISHAASSFDKRRDRAFFVNLSKKYTPDELELFFATNFACNGDLWVGDLLDRKAIKVYTDAMGRLNNLKYTFSSDAAWLIDWATSHSSTLADQMVCQGGDYPGVVKHAIQGNISIESLIIFMVTFRLRASWDKMVTDKIRWPDLSRRLKKYRKFFPIDRNEYRELLSNIMKERL